MLLHVKMLGGRSIVSCMNRGGITVLNQQSIETLRHSNC